MGPNEDVPVANLGSGSFLGETALFFTPNRRTASVRSKTASEVSSFRPRSQNRRSEGPRSSGTRTRLARVRLAQIQDSG